MTSPGAPGAPEFAPGRDRDPVLEIRGLSVDYGFGDDAVHAVVECDLTLGRGRVVGLAGESGSGKSTLAMAAIRLLRSPGVITGGQVLFHPRRHDGGRTGGDRGSTRRGRGGAPSRPMVRDRDRSAECTERSQPGEHDRRAV